METIGIIAAISQETQALLQRIGQWERIPLGQLRAYRFRLSERDCLLIESGMGIKRAAHAARALLEVANPRFLVSFGVAGAVEDDLHIGDVVLSHTTCILDQGQPGQFHPLASLSEKAWQAVAQALELRGARFYLGTAITTPGSQMILSGAATIEHPVLEMETAGIAQVLEEQGIPFLSIRAISDCPREPIPFDLNGTTDEDGNLRLGQMLLMVMRQPKILFQSGRLLRNVRRAADTAAIALVEVLHQPVVLASEDHTNP